MAGESEKNKPITYGHFFLAVSHFCSSDGWRRLRKAASCKVEATVTEKDLQQVFVLLEKHGAFYHPARLSIRVKNRSLSFVVNVAASTRGRKALPHEVKALKQLGADRPFGWFPNVYDASFEGLPMFLGDWFEGFHEFHLTRKKEEEPIKITVWDGTANGCLLSSNQEADLYRSASMILTACYNPLSAHQIFPWHHAAGDFVVRLEGERITTRLITVRNYGPLTESDTEPADEMEIMETLMVFCIHLSMRMRLDRIGGVAEVAWAPATCLAPIMEGFFQGLDLTARMSNFPESFSEVFRCYFNSHEEPDLLSTAHRIKETVYDRKSEEHGLLDRHLPFHVHKMTHIFSTG